MSEWISAIDLVVERASEWVGHEHSRSYDNQVTLTPISDKWVGEGSNAHSMKQGNIITG